VDSAEGVKLNLLRSIKTGMSSIFTKVVSSKLELELQNIASTYKFAPEIYKIEGETVYMKKIDGFCLADLYTDDPTMVPDWIWKEIQRILAVLYEREGIEYIDITGYNFVQETGTNKIWIIDFGHAYYTTLETPVNWFLQEVLDGEKGWNPDFA
jgi:RIO-like serine/threonine protein kinase